jgi:AP-1-like factor
MLQNPAGGQPVSDLYPGSIVAAPVATLTPLSVTPSERLLSRTMDPYQFTDASQQPAASAISHATQSAGDQQNLHNPYLDPDQQDLLLAALNTQASGRQNTESQEQLSISMNGADGTGFISPTEAELDNFGEYTPDLDYLDDGFDFENADLGGEMIGSLPGAGDSNEDLNGAHEKRKNSDGTDADGGNAKRQETGDGEKGAKKPGRKPLTSEPTTVCCPLRLNCV